MLWYTYLISKFSIQLLTKLPSTEVLRYWSLFAILTSDLCRFTCPKTHISKLISIMFIFRCAEFAIPAICHSTFPLCDLRTKKPRKLCRYSLVLSLSPLLKFRYIRMTWVFNSVPLWTKWSGALYGKYRW